MDVVLVKGMCGRRLSVHDGMGVRSVDEAYVGLLDWKSNTKRKALI